MNFPQHPTHNYKCELCKHWLHKDKTPVIVTPQGQAVNIKMALAQGQGLPEGEKSTLSACTRYPKWETMLAEQWCGSFEH